MTGNDTTNSRSIAEEQHAETAEATQSSRTNDDHELVTLGLGGEEILVTRGTTVEELKRNHDLSADAVVTARDEEHGEIVALNDEEVVTERVPAGTELQVQPLSGSEVFGSV
ncbi:hypothetical protein [Natronoglomus mannanivorans]|uniref:Uncharacterized protein n=1 Tax=Natronoglomus mannanivorans TaxID=2979990 RepID=A0AAP3E425_9EURY|nr:hypothetical protein [Halobacteria archaeon AArc-xg1-1]